MFEVLAFVFENYGGRADCPTLTTLHRTLRTVGFQGPSIIAALSWLEDLQHATATWTQATRADPAPTTAAQNAQAAMAHLTQRVLTPQESRHLGPEAWAYLCFLAQQGALSPMQLELVLDRALAAPGNPMDVDDLKLLVLMLFWSLGTQPDGLLLDELCDAHRGRRGH